MTPSGAISDHRIRSVKAREPVELLFFASFALFAPLRLKQASVRARRIIAQRTQRRTQGGTPGTPISRLASFCDNGWMRAFGEAIAIVCGGYVHSAIGSTRQSGDWRSRARFFWPYRF